MTRLDGCSSGRRVGSVAGDFLHKNECEECELMIHDLENRRYLLREKMTILPSMKKFSPVILDGICRLHFLFPQDLVGAVIIPPPIISVNAKILVFFSY